MVHLDTLLPISFDSVLHMELGTACTVEWVRASNRFCAGGGGGVALERLILGINISQAKDGLLSMRQLCRLEFVISWLAQ